ncbi:MAG: phage tail protein [Bacteroidales bacterium]|nr:phage tail protein [Bacteroidales bacterium]
MKKIFLFVIISMMISGSLLAQSGFTYQAVLRNADGSLRDNENINLVAELIQNDVTVYSETHAVTTNDFGAFTIVVGQGASEQSYSSSLFLNTDSTALNETVLRVSEDGGNVLSESAILGVPVAEVAKVALSAHIEFPAGAIIPFAGAEDKIPVGWLLCDGSEYNQSEYMTLYNVIGTNWGSSSAGTFNVPDLRGVSLRGVNGTSDDDFADPDSATRISRLAGGAVGNSVGTYQMDAMQNVTGVIGDFDTYAAIHGASTGPFKQTWVYKSTGIGSGQSDNYNRVDFDLSRAARTSSETHSKNAYVTYIIKY